jgi:hypothetical protein
LLGFICDIFSFLLIIIRYNKNIDIKLTDTIIKIAAKDILVLFVNGDIKAGQKKEQIAI